MMVNRRRKKSWLILFPLPLLLLLLIACGAAAPEDDPAAAAPGDPAQVEATPVSEPGAVGEPARPDSPQGTLTVALRSLGNEIMDPIRETRPGYAQYQAPVFDALLGFNYESEFAGMGPGVAREWEIDPEGTSWTFHLHEGLEFHNGDPLTSDSVKYSVERSMLHPESLNTDATVRLKGALRQPPDAAIEAVDPQTVRMHSDGVQPFFPTFFTRAVFGNGGAIFPKDYIESEGEENFIRNPVGSGPWKFVSHISGDSIEYEAWDGSYRGIPHFEKLEILLAPEDSTRLAMVRTNQVDVIDLVPELAPEALSADMKLTEIGGGAMFNFKFWGTYFPQAGDLPIGDVRVRQALSLAVDRQAIIDHVMNGYARWPLPPAQFPNSFDLDVERWQQWSQEALAYDPDRARELLQEAGYADGFDITFTTSNFPGTPFMDDISLAVVGFWEQVGVNVDVNALEYGVWSPLTRAEAHREPDQGFSLQATIYRNAGRPLGVSRLNTSFHPDGDRYLFGDRNHMTPNAEEFERLYNAIIREPDEDRRFELTNELIAMVVDTWVVVPILEAVALYATNPQDVGYWEGLYGRAELGDVYHLIPHAEGNPWP